MHEEMTKKKKKEKDRSKKIDKMKGQIAEHQALVEMMLESLSSKTEGQEIDNFLEFVAASKHSQAGHAVQEKGEDPDNVRLNGKSGLTKNP